MSNNYHSVNNLKVSDELLSFVNNELLVGTDISPDQFWSDFDKAAHELAKKNKDWTASRKFKKDKSNA